MLSEGQVVRTANRPLMPWYGSQIADRTRIYARVDPEQPARRIETDDPGQFDGTTYRGLELEEAIWWDQLPPGIEAVGLRGGGPRPERLPPGYR